MKPGPKSFIHGMSGLEPDSNPLSSFVRVLVCESERDEIQFKRRRLFDFDLAMHCFNMGPYIREGGCGTCVPGVPLMPPPSYNNNIIII